jgi:pilus assembly protein Flp/PilA
MNTIARFAKDESGATAIEYGLIAMLISVAIIGVLGKIGTSLNNVFGNVNGGLTGAAATK